MKNRVLFLIVVSAFVIFCRGNAALAQGCGSQGSIAISPTQDVVDFSQVVFSYESLQSSPSNTGQIDVNVPAITQMQSFGFLNVVTAQGWVVQNLPILPGYVDDGYANISTAFNLGQGAGQQLSTLDALVCYTLGPVTQAPTGTALSFSMSLRGYNAQGECAGDIAGSWCKVTTQPAPPPVAAISFSLVGNNKFAMQKSAIPFLNNNHPNLQTADNQCSPAAFANNFTWLKATYGTPIPDPNNIGLRNTVANSLVGKLDMVFWSGGVVAGRDARERPDGDTVTAFRQLQGYMTYLAANKIKLTLKHQGCSDTFDGVKCTGKFDGTKNFNFAGLTSTGMGGVVDADFLYNEIKAGSSIKGGYSSNNGGHAVAIVGAGRILGAPFMLHVSDHDQTECQNKALKPCPANMLINDDKGTVDKWGNVRVDRNWLIEAPNTDPVLGGDGFGSGSSLTNVMTQHP